ncbi:D-alanyl-D-alanine carboxypeptidase [Streptomyces spiroverticillatus]|uniref:D-alanyl-D-alanine carboxypeptidase n=1 Tax=Streptomyces finlayi TaxID=67296 RepID=A0A918X2P6_9ACTN|nr:serine hydrolase domain-containing protein [Streptomyces finlayi]GHA23554.1 D-alanyl-D-alanine carboxypeptidase [Streptomyces spiroverticillatus]GHD04846.1 D-alanyl-D-alanine carboxypeptidase [Streptomyces finlayi]
MPVRTRRAPRTALFAAVTAAALAATVVPAHAQDHAPDPHAGTRAAVDALVRDGAPGVVARSEGPGGSRAWTNTAGVGNLTTGRERDAGDRFRIGSLTKTFTATVVLQLEAEGRLSLDDRVEKWLPGVVRGNGHDGSRITLRQLLQHTSGIYNYTSDPTFVSEHMSEGFLAHRYDSLPARALVRVAMKHAPDFEPGAKWQYSNTNYILAGMIIEKATGRSYESEITRRILRPLALRATSVPHDEVRLGRPSSRAYTTFGKDPATAKKYDVTELNPTLAGAAGGMISSTADLNRFYRSLLTGKLLPKRQLTEMKTTVPVHPQRPDLSYGLGIFKEVQSCGKAVWGHTGGIHGSTTHAVTGEDGRTSVALHLNGDWSGDTDTVMEAEFCPK